MEGLEGGLWEGAHGQRLGVKSDSLTVILGTSQEGEGGGSVGVVWIEEGALVAGETLGKAGLGGGTVGSFGFLARQTGRREREREREF